MPSADYILTAPCAEIAGHVMQPFCDGEWGASVGGQQDVFACTIGIVTNVVLLYAAAKFTNLALKFLWRWSEHVFWKCVCTVAVCGMIYVGATKAITSRVNFPRTDMEAAYLIDNGSYVSNDVVHVDFTTFLIPATAPITLAYWPNESTNEEDIVEYITAELSQWPRPLDLEFENAISNRWYCYTTWTPGPAAHTNGVWQQSGMTDRRSNRDTILIRTMVIEDGAQIAPPRFQQEGVNDDDN